MTDRAEVKFVDGWIGFGRLPKDTQGKTTTEKYMSGPTSLVQEVAVAQRKIGRRCDFLEDVSEDVHFDWKFLGDVNFIKEIESK